MRDRIPLADELALTDRFLSIEQVRFGERLQIERHVDAAATRCRVPPLLLQPLVENAVTHGIANLLEGGVIRLDVARHADQVLIAIENPRDADARRARGAASASTTFAGASTTMFGTNARIETRTDQGRFRVELAHALLQR